MDLLPNDKTERWKVNRKALIYFTQFNKALGGSEYLPLLLASDLQENCDVTLALNWKSDVAQAAETLHIPIDTSRLNVIYVKPNNKLLQRLDAILPFYRTWRLKRLAKNADICISTVNMFDFGKPAHHFVFMLRHFGDNEFIDYVNHAKPKSAAALLRRRLRTFLAEHVLRPLLGMRSTRTILADPQERIYPTSRYVADIMRRFYGQFNGKVFYPPTIFAPGTSPVRRDPLKVVYIGQIFPEKHVAEIIGIVEKARATSKKELTLDIAGSLRETTYVGLIRKLSSERPWVRLVGPLYGSDKDAFLRSATYAVHAERDEAFGISVTEYLKAGAVVLVPDEGGTLEIVDSPDLTYRTYEDAAQILARLLSDNDFRTCAQAHCGERAKFFSKEAYLGRQRELLKNIPNT